MNRSVLYRRWHKRWYRTYSDVVFGLVAWIWLSISNVLLSILKFFTIGFKIWWGRLSPASAPPLGPGKGRHPQQSLKPIVKNLKISTKRSRYQPNPCYQPRKRRYLYNSWSKKTSILSKLQNIMVQKSQ